MRWTRPSLAPIVVIDLRLEVERHPETALVEVADRRAQVRQPRLTEYRWLRGFSAASAQLLDGDGRGRQIGVPECEVDHVPAGATLLGLDAVDLGECVRGKPVDASELHRA